MKIELEHVYYMPKELKPGVLYVSREFGAVAHLCACGCGSKIRTPLGPTEWSLEETKNGPSLSPSVGNWQQECQSHYWINQGKIEWSNKWSQKQIDSGRRDEEMARHIHYKNLNSQRGGFLQRLWRWIKNKFN